MILDNEKAIFALVEVLFSKVKVTSKNRFNLKKTK